MDDMSGDPSCPGCGQPVDPGEPDSVLAESTTFVQTTTQSGASRIVPDRTFHRTCLEAKRGVGWRAKR